MQGGTLRNGEREGSQREREREGERERRRERESEGGRGRKEEGEGAGGGLRHGSRGRTKILGAGGPADKPRQTRP